MKLPQQLDLESLDSWNENDIGILKNIYPNLECKEDAIELWKCNTMVRIADSKDYEYAYEDFYKAIENELAYINEKLSYERFLEEMQKGYGNSDFTEISRLFELSNGIWYDNEFC